MSTNHSDDSPLLEAVRTSCRIAKREALDNLRARVWSLQTNAAHLSACQGVVGDTESSRVASERSGAYGDVVRLIDEELGKLT